ncbi:MAG TPA: helix-turn-helix domain-containing protein, partial [Telmatospirillum sp.]|nr:helix-turn-helix domain-containing protein [Telmatospirillum sp.]
RGWHAVSLADIATRAGVSFVELHERFDGKADIFKAFLDQLDDALWNGELPPGEEAERDRLFDVIMRRFDAMQPHKAGIRAIVRGSMVDPWMLLCGAPRLLLTAALMLEIAGISATGPLGRLKAKGLAAVFLAASRVWMNDDSPDMAKTMVALDRSLRRAESLMTFVRRDRHKGSYSDSDKAEYRA